MKSSNIFVLLLPTVAQSLHIPTSRRNSTKSPRDAAPQSDFPTFVYEPIKTGLVAFGDPYAAGIGAGPTSGDGCRVGDFSYPRLLNSWVAPLQPGVDFQNLPCSGATIPDVLQGGEKSQIDKWKNPKKADRATISIGGNDVKFYDILTSCVLRVEQFFAGDCDEYVQKAYDIMYGAEFTNNLDSALRQIIEKSSRSDFRIIQTGYPTFFNNETDSCDYTTFYYWQPGHHGFHRDKGWAYLYKSLRTKLNKLVTDLNVRLREIADGVNQDFDQPRVLFADPNSAFDGHRFCEPGITEPDSSNDKNWLFLAGWPDTSLPGTNSARLSVIPELIKEAEQDQHGMPTPDEAACESSQEWDVQIICGAMKAGIAVDDGGKLKLAKTVELPDGKEVLTEEIRWFIPTSSAKTFHPRTLGHLGMRELVRGIW